MAEIEFKRRGTPVWVVLLALIVLAAILYGIFFRGSPQTAVAPAASGTTPTGPAATPAAPAAPAAPALPPARAFAAWSDSVHVPSAPDAAAGYVADGIRKLGAALRERVPMAGGQHLLVDAMADTIAMPTTTEAKRTDAMQAAFFAAAYAMRGTPPGEALQTSASRLVLQRSITQQAKSVEDVFKAAGRALRDSIAEPAKKAP
jgi:hypothetical protein